MKIISKYIKVIETVKDRESRLNEKESLQINDFESINHNQPVIELDSSEKYQNDVVLKIYKGHNETPDSLLYKLEDKADDNKPSYIDVNLKNYAGNYKFLLKFRFREQKAGCVAFDLGMFKDHNYSFQQKD